LALRETILLYSAAVLASTESIRARFHTRFDWRAAGLRYYRYGYHLRQIFGQRVQKVSVDAGFTCPNVDGTVAFGGCNFCDNRSFSPSRRLPRTSVRGQIDEGIRRLRRRYSSCDQFMAYFQPATNTYAPVDRLEKLYRSALEHPLVVALSIGTRPDCVPEDVLGLLSELAGETCLAVEYGMQTIHDASLDWMNRGHHHDSMIDAMERSRGRGFEIGAHVILGLPTESHDQMMATAAEVGRLQVDSVKIHNLYAVRGTPLGEDVLRGQVTLMNRDDYIRTLVDFLERIPPETIVERVSGDAPPDYFLGPDWCLDKPGTLTALENEFARRDTWQGRLVS
jgi:radical SAM protein (TIGR01212 family)